MRIQTGVKGCGPGFKGTFKVGLPAGLTIKMQGNIPFLELREYPSIDCELFDGKNYPNIKAVLAANVFGGTAKRISPPGARIVFPIKEGESYFLKATVGSMVWVHPFLGDPAKEEAAPPGPIAAPDKKPPIENKKTPLSAFTFPEEVSELTLTKGRITTDVEVAGLDLDTVEVPPDKPPPDDPEPPKPAEPPVQVAQQTVVRYRKRHNLGKRAKIIVAGENIIKIFGISKGHTVALVNTDQGARWLEDEGCWGFGGIETDRQLTLQITQENHRGWGKAKDSVLGTVKFTVSTKLTPAEEATLVAEQTIQETPDYPSPPSAWHWIYWWLVVAFIKRSTADKFFAGIEAVLENKKTTGKNIADAILGSSLMLGIIQNLPPDQRVALFDKLERMAKENKLKKRGSLDHKFRALVSDKQSKQNS